MLISDLNTSNVGTINPTPGTKSNTSYSDFIGRGLKYFGAGVASSVIASKTVLPFMESDMDWCLEFPKSVYTFAAKSCQVREYLPGLTNTYDQYAFKAPIVEELMFRVGLQEIALRKFPKAILNRIAPSYASLVDSNIAKVARIGLSAAAFSLAHAMPAEAGLPHCSAARLVNTFVMGLVFGGIQEVTESPLLAMLCHSGFNIQPAFLISQLGVQMGCPAE